MGLLSSLRPKQGGDAIRQSTTTATMHLLEQNRKFELFMREKVAVLERQVAEDDGRLNNDKGDKEDGLSDEMEPAGYIETDGPGEGQDIDADSSVRAEHEGVAVIGDDLGELEEELDPPSVTPPARPAEPVQPPPSPKAPSAPSDWRGFLVAGASATASPGAPAAGKSEPPAGEGDQVDAQGEDAAEEDDPVETGASEPPAGEAGQADAQGEDAAEEEEEGGGLFAMDVPIISLTGAAEERGRPPSSSATAPAAAGPSAPPAIEEDHLQRPASDVAAPGPDAAGDQSSGEWLPGDLHDGQVERWA